ncbi:dual serine/threonine and tyrosine protein kinase-like [Gigantopelta aegis]|uniref:dual serine/threonine and tyrosine protein kinase-like n=1 Tax=Gigantopelta aegis TaxID=1735272 RepID=UPI001B88CFF6|nr:dual serine/threonine and tyrosine protein kinase-like [Gigantopelta aegis]
MAVSLPSELRKFSGHVERLRQILEETKKCFNDINSSAHFDGTQIVTAELLKEEELEIASIVEKPPTIIIFGQTPYAKSRVVNELFSKHGKEIFPFLDENDDESRFRMVRFKHGEMLSVSLSLSDDYDLVDHLESYNGPWHTVPKKDIELDVDVDSGGDQANDVADLNVTINHPLLRYGTHIVVAPSKYGDTLEVVLNKCFKNTTPILLYGFVKDHLSDKDLAELNELGTMTNFKPVFFIRVPPPGSKTVDTDPPDGAPGSPTKSATLPRDRGNSGSQSWPGSRESSINRVNGISKSMPTCCIAFQQLCRLGYLSEVSGVTYRKSLTRDYFDVESKFVDRFQDFHQRFALFTRKTLQGYLINSSVVLNNTHTRCLNMFIMSAFDMARDMLITPKKLEFVKEKEDDLYKSLLRLAVSKQDEIKSLISGTISDMRFDLVEQAAEYDFIGVEIDDNGQILTAKGLKICAGQIQDLVLGQLNHAVAGKLMGSVDILRDSYTGTLTRCLESLESLDKENPEGSKATDALRQTLNAAYQVEITVRSSSSLIKVLLERMKQLVQAMPWNTQPVIDAEWKKKVASDMLNSLSEARLAKSISSQIKERLTKSHDGFLSSLRQLEIRHCGRLDKIEDQRLKLRKVHAPKVAKLALESTSLKDAVQFGMPQMSREVGRGQYGVVYACDTWAEHSPLAIKSVVPPDDKHWNDLALEFFYTKNIPEHDRIVALRGSVIDYMYGGGTSPAVLLIMDRLQKDLYAAIKQGLDWISRLQVAIDVVEGIRFLHGQGLVHRDIKLKNVLLDRDNRGKITDLGFCKPEAMMSGSIVGTPIHMAPELFTGHYDNSVDVYAFGILFWYVCAGHIRLPTAFEQCANKDHLWQSVKKGLRPEKHPLFDEDCWVLMQSCWDKYPNLRPHLGDVQTTLASIFERFRKTTPLPSKPRDNKHSSCNISKHPHHYHHHAK